MLENVGAEELAGGVGQGADDEAFGTGLAHHLFEEEGIRFGRSVHKGETGVCIACRFIFLRPLTVVGLRHMSVD